MCTFPYVTVDITKPCAVTYAKYLTSTQGFVALPIILGLYAFAVWVVACYRYYLLYKQAKSMKRKMHKMPTFFFFTEAMIVAFFVWVECIDLFGFQGIYSMQFYNIVDEFAASSMLLLALAAIDFYMKMADPLHMRTAGFSRRVKFALIVATLLNFVGFQVIGTCLTDYTFLFESLKSFGGFVILLGFLFLTRKSIGEIVKLLHFGISSTTDDKKKRTGDSNSATTTSPTNGKAFNYVPQVDSATKAKTLTAIKVLRAKYFLFMFAISLAAVGLLVNAFLSLGLGDATCCGVSNWIWVIQASEQIDAVQIVLKIVYFVVLSIILIMFNNPKMKHVELSKIKTSTHDHAKDDTVPDNSNRMVVAGRFFFFFFFLRT